MYSIRVAWMTIISFLLLACSAWAQSTDRYDLDKVYSISSEGTINLESDDSTVEIVGTDRDDVHLVVHYSAEISGFTLNESNRFKMMVEEKNGDLFIRERERDFNFSNISVSFRNVEYTIVIEAPRNVALELYGDDDNYSITDISGSIKMDIDDGNARLTRCRGSEFSFDMDDGELDIDELSGRLKIDIDDGEVNIQKGNFERLDIDGDDPSITLTTVLHNNGEYNFEFDDGSLDMGILGGGGEFQIDHDGIRISTNREFRELDADDNYSVYQLAGGTAVVHIRTDDGRIRLGVR